jgi:predicted SnoaL-like aldol condensation-catalyzing enzyme
VATFIGIGGRLASESVAGMDRNYRPLCLGIRNPIRRIPELTNAREDHFMDNKEIIRRALKSLFEDYRGSHSEFIKYFSSDFRLWMNGKTMGLTDFLAHFEKLQESLPDRRIDFVDLVAGGNTVFDQHVVTAIRSPDDREFVDVFAKWTVVDGLITGCEELTRHREASEGAPGADYQNQRNH